MGSVNKLQGNIMKRFTETDKWSDPWFQSLSHGAKLLFVYLLDRSNNAGFYEENSREACFHLGITEDQYKGALKALERGIKGASGWIWIKNFLKHQKNLPINPENPAHRQIVFLLQQQTERFNGVKEFEEFVAPYMGLLCPIGIGKGKVKVRGSAEGVASTADQIIEELSKKECYKAIEVRTEWEKMKTWCEKNKKVPSERRFVNWLNRVEVPMNNGSSSNPMLRPVQ